MRIKFSTNIFFFFISFLLVSIYAQPTPPKGVTWEIVPNLTDEFDTWDETKWRKELWDYPAPNKMKEENSGVTDGKLWIKASVSSDKNTERWFETSRIYSLEQISFPIYIECRMKTANISAYNTFWLNDGDAKDRDEIDICENMSNPINKDPNLPYIRQSQFFILKNGVEERSKRVHPEIKDNFERVADFDNRNLSDKNPAKGKKWNEDFQTFGLYWKDANHMTYYINGEESGTDISKTDFTRSLNVIWDLWTHDHDGGLATKESLQTQNDSANTMYIDWIHTYTYSK
ncbi:family 16 glycosylhydrolase [Aquimarina sp. RZ0]|uniref:family 16 glycosylhydrolase n=1 Tax=Aquimarina sp. RZ0 TaxID=2607730 RepID=UPI0011F0A45E|nr:family 16 glycosylhydrolase [Aquimarina sp. RZ0]KAA1247016.1 family 16 glycosylhydrolase [Aquimarina sp. RZ0]